MLTDYTAKGVAPDMTEAAFLAVLREAGSPVPQDAARAVYAYSAGRRLSPAFLLAMFRHESTFGRFGSAALTKSWGNTRPPSYGVEHVGVSERNFSVYANWADGGVSTAARLFDHPAYAGKDTVRAIIPTWAPATDGNDPERYIAAVLADIERWAAPVPAPTLSIHEAIIPATNANRPGRKMWNGRPAFITWHETSNYTAGANAAMHERFARDGGGDEGVSFHYVVDDREAYHLIPDDEIAWHAGDGANGPGNNSSIAIEQCVNRDGDLDRARRNCATLVALLMRRHGLTRVALEVVQHNRWSGKNCPLLIRDGGLWPEMLGLVQAAYEAQEPQSPAEARIARAWRVLLGAA